MAREALLTVVPESLPPGVNAMLPPAAMWRKNDDDTPVAEKVYYALHSEPEYNSDPGNGLELWASGGRVFLSIFWDGAARDTWELIR